MNVLLKSIVLVSRFSLMYEDTFFIDSEEDVSLLLVRESVCSEQYSIEASTLALIPASSVSIAAFNAYFSVSESVVEKLRLFST